MILFFFTVGNQTVRYFGKETKRAQVQPDGMWECACAFMNSVEECWGYPVTMCVLYLPCAAAALAAALAAVPPTRLMTLLVMSSLKAVLMKIPLG